MKPIYLKKVSVYTPNVWFAKIGKSHIYEVRPYNIFCEPHDIPSGQSLEEHITKEKEWYEDELGMKVCTEKEFNEYFKVVSNYINSNNNE